LYSNPDFVESQSIKIKEGHKKYKLTDIAKIINNLDNYKVEIKLGNTPGKSYIGFWRGLPIKIIGLEQGIKETYNKLKH
jgi:hypothetical protein